MWQRRPQGKPVARPRPASEAVGRVGDPVRRLLLGALGRAVAGEDGLVGLRPLTVCDGPLQGPAGGLADFPRSTPVSCWKTTPKLVRLGLKIIPNDKGLKRPSHACHFTKLPTSCCYWKEAEARAGAMEPRPSLNSHCSRDWP